MDVYLEVMEFLCWVFEVCGIECSVCVNELDLIWCNIVFGWIVVVQINQFVGLLDGSIFYNFEQFFGYLLFEFGIVQMLFCFQVWDYSVVNMVYWCVLCLL